MNRQGAFVALGRPPPQALYWAGESGHWYWRSEALGLWERDGDEAQPRGILVRLRWLNQGQRVGRVSVGPGMAGSGQAARETEAFGAPA